MINFIEEVLAITLALALYDYIIDEFLDRASKKTRKFLNRHGIS